MMFFTVSAPQGKSRCWLWLECTLLFGAVPLLLFYLHQGWVLPFLWLAGLGCGLLLWLDPSFDRANLWRGRALRQAGWRLYGLVLAAALGFSLILALYAPQLLFSLPRQRPALWLMVMLLYPVLSVYPQKLIYRTFFFHRYQALFSTDQSRIVASALSFGFMHIIFHNWIAVLLTCIGGLLFARSYAYSRSTALAAWEHALYGCLLFTVGLGRFFYSGGLADIPAFLRF